MTLTPAERLTRPERSGAWPLAVALGALAPVAGGFVSTHLLAYRLGAVSAEGLATVLGSPWLVPALGGWVYGLGAALAGGVAVGLAGQGPWRVLAVVPLGLGALFLALVFGPVYPPFRGLAGLLPLLKTPGLRPWAVEALAVGVAVGVGVLALAAVPVRRSASKIADIAHGSARLGTLADLEAAGLTSPTGVRLGAFRTGRHRVLLHDDSEDHVLLIMPTGAGKTTGHIVPTLLSSPESAFVLDPKGELWRTTAGWRKEKAKQRCLYFAPTSADPGAVAWNCFDEVRRDGEMMLDLRVVAESFLTHPADPAESHSGHWIDSARRLFQLLSLHLIEVHRMDEGPAPTIDRVRALLNDPGRSLPKILQQMLNFDHDSGLTRGFRSPLTGEPTTTHPEVAMLARSFLSTPDREMGSIVSTLQRFLGLWADPLVARNTSRSDFSISELLDPGQPVTLYVALPYGDLEPLGPLLRILLGLTIRRMTERPAGEGRRSAQSRMLFLLDEFAALGRLPILERMLGFFRGYGIRAVIVVQDLGQLVRAYSAQETISGNCQVHVAAATQSARTRAHLSALAGEATVRYRRRSTSGEPGAILSSRTTQADTEIRRPLVTPGEVGTLGKDRLLVLKTGAPPVLAWKSLYFNEPEMVDRASEPPPEARDTPQPARPVVGPPIAPPDPPRAPTAGEGS